MTWATLATPPTFGAFGGQIEGAQLLNDGRILCYWLVPSVSSFSSVFTPASNGVYESGTWSTPKDMVYEHHGGALLLASNGYVYCMGSHPFAGTSTGQYVINRWDPKTDTWTALYNPSTTSFDWAGVQHQGRGGLFITDDGKACWLRAGGLHVFDPKTETLSIDSSVSNIGASECGASILPDGRMMHLSSAGVAIYEFKPQYDASRVAAGSISSGGNTVNITSPTITHSQETWMYSSGSLDWLDPSGFGLNSEVGSHMYHYKSGKLVSAGAWAGEIFEVDTTTKNVSVRTKTPIDTYLSSYQSGTLSSSHAGKTARQLITGGSITVTFNASYYSTGTPTFLLFPAGTNRWVALTGTPSSTSALGGTATTITYSALTYHSGDRDSIIPTGATFNTGYAPQYASGEGCCAILPSGKFAYMAGIRTIGGIAGAGNLFLWDGTDSAPVKADFTSSALFAPWLTHMSITPTGQLFVVSSSAAYLYTETGVLADSAQIPIIDNVPAYLGQDATHFIVGKQLTGLHTGSAYSDETPNQCNHTLVRLTASDGTVYFLPTTNWSYRGIQANRPGSCNFKVPKNIPLGTYTLHAIANGVPSAPYTVTVTPGIPSEGVFVNSYLRA